MAAQGISWPRLESGKLALDDDTFREIGTHIPFHYSNPGVENLAVPVAPQ